MADSPEAPSRFEEFMAQGIKFRNSRMYPDALDAGRSALDAAEGPLQTGRAYRDLGHTHFRFGEEATAEGLLDLAVVFHKNAQLAGLPGAGREYRASVGYSGIYALAKAIASEGRDRRFNVAAAQMARDYLRIATPIEEAPERIDQYSINFIGRHAITEGLYVGKTAGLNAALRARTLGGLSESPDLPYSNRKLSEQEITAARRKAQNRALAAYWTARISGVDDSYSLDIDDPPQYNVRRRAALILATKVI